jgi:superfamily I DNA and/or RNA helicase
MALIHLEPLTRRVSKTDILAFLEKVGGVGRQRIGRIELHGNQAVIEVPDGWESRLVQSLDGQPLGERRVRAWTTGRAEIIQRDEDHFRRLARLLDLESRAEAQRAAEQSRRMSLDEAQKSGNTLADLVVTDDEAGLGGRYLVSLGKRGNGPLPWTRLGVGSPVVMTPLMQKVEQSYRGVVCDREERAIRVALDRLPEDLADYPLWRIDLSFDEVAIQRQKVALDQARSASGNRFAVLRDVLLGVREPEFGVDPAIRIMDASLNEIQREAVQFASSARDVALIHGPPGTGKTTAIVEIIRQAVRRGRKVLACSPSNLAVDNIFERLLRFGEKAVRLGHPARVLPELRDNTIDLLVERHPDVRLAHKLVKQAMGLFREADRHTRAAPKPGAKRQLREDAKSLLADARRLETQAVESILDSARILCVTTTGIDSQILGTRRFDLAVIDEACQSVEPGCWIPLLRCDRVVFAGDHCQLPPTVVSPEAIEQGFGVSIFERLMQMTGSQISRRLAVQYRMHRAIMDFSSREFYEGGLEADSSVAKHLLADLPGVESIPSTQCPVEFIDTAGASFDEELEPDGESRLNRREAELVRRKVIEWSTAGVAAKDIAVISPYAAQVRLLRELLDVPNLEIDSVDGFQGREKEAVVISLVRSNAQGQIGFLGDVRRMNVAMTRARRKLLVIGDSATLANHPFYQRMIEYFETLGAYRTVWEEGCDA